jgi:hypothetical protein
VILDDWRREERGALVATSMRVRSPHAPDSHVTIAVPRGFEGPEGDASPFVAALLPLALTAHEDVHADAAVSARLLRGAERAVATYCGWDPRLRPAALRAAGHTAPPPERAPGAGCLLSRGVDSVFSAAAERLDPAPLTHLVHWRGLEPRHSPGTVAAEERECRALAGKLGLPLLVAETDLRAVLDRGTHYHDTHGAALAGLAIALGGGLGRHVIPGTDSARSLGPMGSSPALDGHLATEWVEVEHDGGGVARVDKVAAIAAQRPDLLPHLKVCFAEDRADNCGRCGKCVLTMCALAAAGALEQATAFPALDLARVREQRPSPLRARHEWAETLLALGTTGAQGELRAAMEHALRRAARPAPAKRARAALDRVRGERARLHPSWRAPERGFDWGASTRALALLHHGAPEARPSHAAARPLPQPRLRGGQPESGELAGLLRAVDRDLNRHRYAAGAPAPGAPAGELGALLAEDPGGGVALWLTPEGTPVLAGHPPPRSGAPLPRRLAWALAPLGFAGVPPRARARGAAARLRNLAGPAPDAPKPAVAPAGFLYAQPAPGRVPLLLADHPVLPDRLLTTRRAEAADLGYPEPVVVGHLVRAAPVTGTLEPPPCDVPWAHRFGLSRRSG